MGYEAYEITGQNYDIMEKLLNTDLSQFSIDREEDFSVLLVIGDEINPGISPMSSVSSEFNYTYQGVTYRMRTVTLTSSDNPAYNKANTVNLINSNSANLINNALNTAISALVSTVSKTLGYLYSILGINVNAVGTTQAMNLNLQAHSNWTRRYTQVYSTYDKAWANGSCVEFVTCLSYITGTYYNKNLNRAQSCSGQRDTVVYSSNYNNDTWKRNNAADGFKTGNVHYNLTGDVKYKFGGTVKVTHTENF